MLVDISKTEYKFLDHCHCWHIIFLFKLSVYIVANLGCGMDHVFERMSFYIGLGFGNF
jgi:hypothetical protein